MKYNEDIYILEATAYHWAKDEHMSLLEQKQMIGYGDTGKEKLKKSMKQIACVWQKIYVDNRDDTQVIIHLYSTVQSNGLILKDDVCDYKIIGGENNRL